MQITKEAFSVRGGCDCGACRFHMVMPAWEHRALYELNESKGEDETRSVISTMEKIQKFPKIPHAVLSQVIVTDLLRTTMTCLKKGGTESYLDIPALQLYNKDEIKDLDVLLTCYEDQSDCVRWFCRHCATHIAYYDKRRPKMLEILVAAIDRSDIKKVFKTLESTQSIDEMLAEARSHLRRLKPYEARYEWTHQSKESPVMLVDIRPAAQRAAEGMIEGAMVIERNVLEWRFDPQCESRLPVANSHDLRVVVFCQEGYTSSLAARSLQHLGLRNATDMAGGLQAWKDARFPVIFGVQ